MQRNQEYKDLLHELGNTPPSLNGAVERAKARDKKRNLRRMYMMPVSTAAALMFLFVAMVNVSPVVASAMEQIPVIGRLAETVNFTASIRDTVARTPSLQPMVEHGHYISTDLEQTINGITMRIEYIIAAPNVLTALFTIESENYNFMDVQLKGIYDVNTGEPLESRASVVIPSAQWRTFSGDDGEMGFLTAGVAQLPEQLILTAVVRDTAGIPIPELRAQYALTGQQRPIIAEFSFLLEICPENVPQSEVLELNQNFEIDGQIFMLNNLIINPTFMQLNVEADANNTALLSMMDIHLRNEMGERFRWNGSFTNEDGVTALFFESAFFTESESFELVITHISWLDNDRERVRIDLAEGTADWFPENVEIHDIWLEDDVWNLIFRIQPIRPGMSYGIFHSFFLYRDQHETWDHRRAGLSWHNSSESRYFNNSTNRQTIRLYDFPYDVVYFAVSHSRQMLFDTPLVVQVK